ncbi:hypothetical protein X735_05955 [Mesorhizobium sp. L2C085B000]|nr:hypothetical protein X735_05955 [Mesorhizobium sp. L2C085B000]
MAKRRQVHTIETKSVKHSALAKSSRISLAILNPAPR